MSVATDQPNQNGAKSFGSVRAATEPFAEQRLVVAIRVSQKHITPSGWPGQRGKEHGGCPFVEGGHGIEGVLRQIFAG